jgi:hypothetical protein
MSNFPSDENSSIGSERTVQMLITLGWYLDTSLFLSFIQQNIRIGFDTGEDHDGHTILQVKGSPKSKSGVRTFVPVIAGGKRFAFQLTKNIEQLRNIQVSNNILFYYSELTKAEVIRHLRRVYLQRAKSEILDWWHAFCFVLLRYQKIEIDFPIDEELSALSLDFPINKNVQDYIHLIIAKKKGLAFITDDKLGNQIEDLKKVYYPHIYSWSEIKYQIPIDPIFERPRR